MLVVGPNPTFMDYVSHVLPALGEEAVEQRAVSELLDGIVVEREEAMDVAALKADPRLSEVVQRAVELSVRPAPEELVLYADGVFVSVKERDVRELLDAALEDGAALQLARERFRMAVLRRFYERYGELLGPRALRSFEELEGALRRNGFLTKYLDRVLPLPRAEKLVARLLTSPRRSPRPRRDCSTAVSSGCCCATVRGASPSCSGAHTTFRSSTSRARWSKGRRARTGTSSSTRRRISRRCSCSWCRAARWTDR